MSYYKLSFVYLLCILFSSGICAQHSKIKENEGIVSGQVVDSETGTAIPYAEIFISGTTRGCISDINGRFSLDVHSFPCTLVADHVAYETYASKLNAKKTIQISLTPKIYTIKEIHVSSKSNRKKNLKLFYRYFIGDSHKNIAILNDSVLRFKNTKKEFVAYSEEPLVYINKTLGYKTKVTIKEFMLFRKEYPYGPKLSLISGKGGIYVHMSGYYFYSPLESYSSKQTQKYETNRHRFYYGSEKHFFRSMYNNDLSLQGFELKVFPEHKGLKGFREIKKLHAGLTGKHYFMDCDSIKITYWYDKNKIPINVKQLVNKAYTSHEVSTIYRSKAFFTLRENGTSPNVNFIAKGPLSRSNSFANSLPQDYNPFLQ